MNQSTILSMLILLWLIPLSIASQTKFETAETFFQSKQFQKAKSLFEEYLIDHPDDPKTREYLGDIDAHLGNLDKAIAIYRDLSLEFPTNANYHYKYGGALGIKVASLNRFKALTLIGTIKKELEEAARLDPSHIDTRWALIAYYTQLPVIFGGSEKRAISYADELAGISKVDGYLARGHIAEYYRQFNKAEKFYKLAIETGHSPHSYDRLIALYEKDNRPQEVIKTATKALQLHQDNHLNYLIGRMAAQYDIQRELGIFSLGKYIANYSENDKIAKEWAYLRLAQIYRNLGLRAMALTWIEKAFKSNPNFEEAQVEKSTILNMENEDRP